MTVIGGAVALILVVVATLSPRGRRRAMLLGTAAGTLFGLVAGLAKVTLYDIASLHGLLTRWTLWVLLGLGAWAVLLNQRAYQTARVTMTVPILNLCQLAVGLTFGWVVFGERPAASPILVAVEVCGLIMISIGVIELARQGTFDSARAT